MKLLFVFGFLSIFSTNGKAQAPHSFGYRGKNAVFIDISTVHIKYTYDVSLRKVHAKSLVKFKSLETGYPLLDLVPDPIVVKIDDKELSNGLTAIVDPDRQSTMRVLETEVNAQEEHELYIEYEIANNVVFGSGTIRSAFAMSDLTDRMYFENYGPANLEFDTVQYFFEVEVVGTTVEHIVMNNGELKNIGFNSWLIEFPKHFTASSLYFHLFEKGAYKVVTEPVRIGKKRVDLTFYSANQDAALEGLKDAKNYLTEFNSLFGEYCYSSFVGYITGYATGGMEYAGATRSSLEALRHEINHSWFARCVKPANGNAGWMDEAIAMWSDNNFETANGLPDRAEVNLANGSQYQRLTPMESYTEGEYFIRELDFLLKGVGGMKKMLADYFNVKKFQTTNTPFFQNFLEQNSGKSLNEYFKKYVYGKDEFKLKSQNKTVKNRKTGVIYHRDLTPQEQRSQL